MGQHLRVFRQPFLSGLHHIGWNVNNPASWTCWGGLTALQPSAMFFISFIDANMSEGDISMGLNGTKFIGSIILVASVGVATTYGGPTSQVNWVRQLGTPSAEGGYGISADALNNVFVTGCTWGNLGGLNAGTNDVFVAKYSAAGNLTWVQQFGTGATDWGTAISADPLGNAYVGGYTYGNLAGGMTGQQDAFVAKYDATGGQVWARQFGMRTYNPCYGVATDASSNV
jgi:hypothetical protein